jgi:glucose-6-phosphate 1-dehydrogenase
MNNHYKLPPTVLAIFGGAGDLSWRKLVPALFNSHLDRDLPEPFVMLGLDRAELSDEDFRQRLKSGVDQFSRRGRADQARWDAFASKIRYLRADFTDPQTYSRLGERLGELDHQWEAQAHRVFYLATPPVMFSKIASFLDEAGLAHARQRTRVVIEKPIGYDADSARELNAELTRHFDEGQIFRIDHYLGKETVQNLLAFRFANALFEPIWDRRYVDHVAITVAEEVGVEHRGEYYERAGALRDMVQNHLMQLLCLIAMEPPVSFDAGEVRNKKVDVLRAVRPLAHRDVHQLAARGQYDSGWIQGQRVPAYRAEEGVARDSYTETFAALKLFVDNWRWQDVPFYLRTGKRLARFVSEVSIRFRAVPHQAFPPEAALDWQPARLVISIQPDEGIVLKFQAKQPGPRVRLRPVDMRFSYEEAFQVPSPDAYETLLWDVMMDDATLFMRADQVEAAWSILMPILEVWEESPPSDFPNYPAGTWGPEAAEVLVAQDGRSWLQPTVLRRKAEG